MTRRRYPPQGVPLPETGHWEDDPSGESSREHEMRQEADGSFSLQVRNFAGGILHDVIGALGPLRELLARSIGHQRSVQAAIERILFADTHPKQILYQSPSDVALAAGVQGILAYYVDISGFRYVGWYVANVGAVNPITAVAIQVGDDVLQNAPYQSVQSTSAPTIAAGTANYSQCAIMSAACWTPATTTPLVAQYLRIYATSALGTSARCRVIGMR